MLLLSALSLLSLAVGLSPLLVNAKKNNVLVIMSDDQDKILDSLSFMPNVMQNIGKHGATFDKHYCTVSLCCPSRANFFTGRAAHNTNITSLQPPYGGWPTFHDYGLDDDYLPVWINESGISTYYVGKFMNYYSKTNFNHPHPKGWTDNSFLVDPWTYNYFYSHWTDGYTNEYKGHPGIHTTTVTEQKALKMLDKAAAKGDQFFMMVAPVAPHVQAAHHNGHRLPGGPPPPPKYAASFNSSKVPRDPNFNPKTPSGSSWVYNLPQLTNSEVKSGDEHYRDRIRNVAGVDDMVGSLINRLQAHNLLEETYVIYTTDNGFHISQHRLPPGKTLGYETDINIPLLIRGPDVPQNVVSEQVHSHTDMAPTILNMLGVPLRNNFDGQPIDYQQPDNSVSGMSEFVNVEFWDNKVPLEWDGTQFIGIDGDVDGAKGESYNNTYKSLRMQSSGHSFYYSVWCDGSHEFYDMTADYYQMNNLLGPNGTTSGIQYFNRPAEQLFHRLDTLLMVLKSCKMDACRNPWPTIFPGKQATNLQESMDSKYDNFFQSQPQVSFKECIPGYIPQLEGPQNVNPYHS